MSTFDTSSQAPPSQKGVVPANIEEGVDPYGVTSLVVAGAEGSVHAENEVAQEAADLGVDHEELETPTENKIRAFKRAVEEQPDLHGVLENLTVFIKRTRFLKTRYQPKEYYVRQQACMVGFLFATRIKRQRLGYRDIRELFVNLYDLYEYCLKGIPKSAALVLIRLLHSLIVTMAKVAAAIEQKSRARVTNWDLLAETCKSLGAEHIPEFDANRIMPSTSLFETRQILGQGGFGVVTKALFGGCFEVAVKMVPLDKQVQPKYAAVDKVTACLVNHPLVMRYHCTFQSAAAHVTVMECVDAVDLLDVVNEYSKRRNIPLKVKQHIIAQVCLGLSHLHFKGFIHRDIKPSNIMITRGCRIKLFDFDTVKIGMGKFSNRQLHNFYSRTANEFHDRETAGTIYFFPPEALMKKNYGRSIDWWALGITLYEMAFGYLPFRSSERAILKDLIKCGAYSFPKYAELDSPEVKFMERCLQKNPTRRLCASDYNEFRTHDYLKDTNWPEVEVSMKLDWTGAEKIMRRMRAKKEAKFQESKLAGMPYIEQTTADPATPALYTFTSASFLNVMDKLSYIQGLFGEEPPELIQLDVVQRYRFRDYLS